MSPQNIQRRHFKPTLKRAELSSAFRLYDLRHTMATLLLLRGVHPKIVSERLGHASITLTLDTYSHVLPTMQTRVAEQLETILYSPQIAESSANENRPHPTRTQRRAIRRRPGNS